MPSSHRGWRQDRGRRRWDRLGPQRVCTTFWTQQNPWWPIKTFHEKQKQQDIHTFISDFKNTLRHSFLSIFLFSLEQSYLRYASHWNTALCFTSGRWRTSITNTFWSSYLMRNKCLRNTTLVIPFITSVRNHFVKNKFLSSSHESQSCHFCFKLVKMCVKFSLSS